MKCAYTFCCAILCIALMPTEGRGSITLGTLSVGVQNELEDDDFEMLVNAGGNVELPGADTVVDVGDFLAGILRITAVRIPAGGAQVATASDTEATITALFLTKVASVTASAGGALDGNNDVNITFTAPSLLDWATVFAPVAGANIATSAGTIAVVFADPDNIDQTTGGISAFATPDGTELWELGFTGAAGEFWSSNVDTADSATAFALTTGSFTANINVTEQGAGPILIPQQLPSPPFPPGAGAQVFLRNGSFGSGAPGANPPFPISSDVDILITPVPEPVSLAMWTALVVFGTVAAIHRRRKLG